MAEPNTTAVGGFAIVGALLAPIAPQLAVVLLFGVGGGLIAATKAKTKSTIGVAGWGLRGAIFSAACSWGIARAAGLDVSHDGFMYLAPVALFIGLFCHRWQELGPWIKRLVLRNLGAKSD